MGKKLLNLQSYTFYISDYTSPFFFTIPCSTQEHAVLLSAFSASVFVNPLMGLEEKIDRSLFPTVTKSLEDNKTSQSVKQSSTIR